MGKFIDLTGQVFGRLTVIERAEDYIDKNGRKYVAFVCKCSCGNTKKILTQSLTNNDTKSCGCIHKKRLSKTLKGKSKYTNFFVRAFSHINEKKQSIFECECVCGKTVFVSGPNIFHGKSKSCGCIKKKVNREKQHLILYLLPISRVRNAGKRIFPFQKKSLKS